MASAKFVLPIAALLLAAYLAGCATSPPPGGPPPAGAPAPPPPPGGEPPSTTILSGAQDSTAPAPGSPDALYRYRFIQTMPGSSTFTFQDRELSFRFRPAPDALYLFVENRQDRPTWIEWERSVFYDPKGNSGPVAHATTTWADRFSTQPATQIPGLQRYSDYLLPMDYLVDPAGGTEQLHRPLLPEDATAPQYSDKEFGVDLVFRIEDKPRTYSFRFRVASVIPR